MKPQIPFLTIILENESFNPHIGNYTTATHSDICMHESEHAVDL